MHLCKAPLRGRHLADWPVGFFYVGPKCTYPRLRPLVPEFHLCDYPHPPMWAQVPLKADIRKTGSPQQTISEEPSPTMDLNRGAAYCRAKKRFAKVNIEALCAAPPEALTHSPSQMPLSCPVAPKAARS